MDGGRGGGRGKGKKVKATKKKAAAAAAQAQAQAALAAQAAHKQKPHHSGKTAAASHASGQVVAVSKASPATASAQAEATAHEQTMTKSKRKRLKKAAAGALLKKQAEADKQPHKKPPTAAAVSPKTKNVAVLTPPPPAAAAAAAVTVVKPHVVSLTGGKKKKKRKRNAGAAAAAEEGPSEEKGQEKKEKKVAEVKKKTVVLVGKASATSPSVAAKGKSLTPTSTSPKRKIAQLGSASQKTKEKQHVQKEAGVVLTTASPKSGLAASPRKIVKKVKAKTETPGDKKTVGAGAPAKAKGEPQVAAEKLEAKKPAAMEGEAIVATKKAVQQQQQQEQKPVVVVKSPAATSLKADTATQSRTIAQVDTPVKHSPTNRQLPESAQGNTTCDVSPNASSTNEAATTLRKATKTAVSQAAATTASAIAADDKLAVSKPASRPVVGASDSSKAAHGDSSGTSSSTAKVASESHGSVSTSANGLAQACPATPVDETVVATPTTTQEDSTRTSPGSVTAKPSSPALPSGGLKRRRSTDQGSVNSSTLQPPVKRSAVASEAAPSQPAQAKRSDSRDKRTPTDTPRCSSDQTPSLQMASTSQSERSTDTSLRIQDTQKERTTARGRLTPPVRKVPHLAQNAAQAPANNIVSAPTGATAADATKQLKPPHNPKVTPSVTAPTKSQTGRLPVKNASPDTAPRSRKVDIIMDSHSYVHKLMQDELMANSGDCRGDQSAELAVALPPRPRNAWGASFGMAPPSNTASSARRTMPTTPLSSWFLSKGSANFMKTVHFSDNDDGSSDDDSGDISTPELHSDTPRGIDKASPKRRTSVVKKNAFLESLKTQSNWRSWYGNVDMRNLLDPPLAHVPVKLQTHNVTPLELPEATEIRAADKRASDLEMLEHDIRREKQRGSAFSEQLLMMLQGKTVSGKPLEEEYKQILQ